MTADDLYSRTPRVYVETALAESAVVSLAEGQAHHLRQVLRLADAAHVRVFNAGDGEYAGQLRFEGKRGAAVLINARLRLPQPGADIWLVATPLKKDAFDMMVEKASELGAARFVPVITDHTVVHRVNSERLIAQAVDAAEQCERLDVMQFSDLAPVATVLKNWPTDRRLFVALERSAAPPFLQVLHDRPATPTTPLAVLVGPEGGFSAAERAQLLALPFAEPVSLGPTILRAETAGLAALAVLGGFLQGHGV